MWALTKRPGASRAQYTIGQIEAAVGIYAAAMAGNKVAANQRLAAAGLTATDVDSIMKAHPAFSSAVLPASPEPVAEELEEVVVLPDGFNFDDLIKRAKVEDWVSRTYSPSYVPLWPLGEADPVDGVRPKVPLIDSRPEAHMERISASETNQANKVAARGRANGWGDMIAFEPEKRVATFAHLDPFTRLIRSALARELGLKNVWDLELVVRDDFIVITRSPALGGDLRRVDTWQEKAHYLLPTSFAHRWKAIDDAITGRVYIRKMEDRLTHLAPYDWNATVGYDSIPFGVTEDGCPMSLGLLEKNMLLGGLPGGGKSGGLTALLCGIARLENVALIGLDPKMVELSLWTSRFSHVVKGDEGANEVLEALMEEMGRRYQWLDAQKMKKFGPAHFSAEHPLLVLVIDELADLVSIGVTREDKNAEQQRSTIIRRLIAKGRAAGIVVIAATQKPQASVIPTELRDLIQLRVGYATTTTHMTETILGDGMSRNGGDCHFISALERGVCFVVAETSRTPMRARTYWVPDEEVEAVSDKYAHLRIDLPWLNARLAAPLADMSAACEPEPGEGAIIDVDLLDDLLRDD